MYERLEKAARDRTPARDELIQQRAESLAEPAPEGCRKPYLAPPEDRFREQALHRFAEHVLGGPAAQLQAIREGGRKFDQLVVQERHAAFD